MEMQEMLQCMSPSSFSIDLSVVDERQSACLQWQHGNIESIDDEADINLSCDGRSLISVPVLLLNPPRDDEFISNGLPAARACSASSLNYKKERIGLRKRNQTGKSPMVDCYDDEAGIILYKRRKAADQLEKSSTEITEAPPAPAPPKQQDFIHVRARRGQATDSHSLAERVRRERISERMKYLQELVPGCDKITGKAGMLDEIINYVQSLQRQVEFLSMKLATANPWVDFDIDSVFPFKEMNYIACCNPNINIHTVGVSSHEMVDPHALHMNNPMHQMAAYCGLNINTNVSDLELALRRSYNSPVPVPDAFFAQSFEVDNSSWEANSESICGNGLPAGNLKMEMG